MNVVITQSNYIPWKGGFDAMALADVVVLYDEMQYTKRDWRNRNIIKTPQGLRWLTIPVEVKGKYLQKINETRISDKRWNQNHLNLLKQNYRNANCYNEVISWVEELYKKCEFEFLSDINQYFIENINQFLGIKTEIIRTEKFVLADEKTERLVDICKKLNATDYFSGPAAKKYMDESKFSDANIKVNYFDYSGYKEYEQLHGEFDHRVSILDLIFNVGDKSSEYLKYIK